MLFLQLIALAAILIIFFILSVKFRFLDTRGSVIALLLGLAIGIFGGLDWLILMLVFAVTSYGATRAWLEFKQKKHLQEGTNGERHFSNVISAGLPGLIVVFFNVLNSYWINANINFFLIFAVSYAVIEADTFASEIGIIDPKVVMVTTMKETTQGANGGVSLTGTIASFAGGFVIAGAYDILSGSFSIVDNLIIVALAALGSLVDSILGATLENRNLITKGQVNFLSSIFCVALVSLIILL